MAISEKWKEDDFVLIKTGKGKTFAEEDAEEGGWIQRVKNMFIPVNNAGEEGTWITINGNHILLKDGETPAQGFERTTGRKLSGSKGSSGGSDSGGGSKTTTRPEPQRVKTGSLPLVIGDDVDKVAPENYLTNKNISKEERKEIGVYVGDGHKVINSEMRSGKVSKETQSKIDQINTAMSKSSLKEDTILYRGVPEHIANKLVDGNGMSDPAFQSTTTNIITAAGFASDDAAEYTNIMVMKGKKGENAIHSKPMGENEIILKGAKYEVSEVKIIDSLGLVKEGKRYEANNKKPVRLIVVTRGS